MYVNSCSWSRLKTRPVPSLLPPCLLAVPFLIPQPPAVAAAPATVPAVPGSQPAAPAAAVLGSAASTSVAPAAPALPVAGATAAPGAASGVGGGAKLEASLLANLKKKIQEKAAAPEKLKTTGVAFQAVEEVCWRLI